MAGPPAAAKQFNRAAVKLAGHRIFPLWAVLHHRGRVSGKEYATPIAAIPGDGVLLIGLPWGRGTDWVRNVRAAGGCTVRWKGADHVCTDPVFVDLDTARSATSGLTRRLLARGGMSDYLQLTPVG